jgi:hypothetical protein
MTSGNLYRMTESIKNPDHPDTALNKRKPSKVLMQVPDYSPNPGMKSI